MKAIVHEKYGSLEFLQLKEVKKPTPHDNEVLIRIHAVTVGLSDIMTIKGVPFLTRFFPGLIKPKNSIPGAEFPSKYKTPNSNVNLFGFAVTVN